MNERLSGSQRHGLIVIDNLSPLDLTQRYLIGSDGKPAGRLPDAHGVIDAIHGSERPGLNILEWRNFSCWSSPPAGRTLVGVGVTTGGLVWT